MSIITNKDEDISMQLQIVDERYNKSFKIIENLILDLLDEHDKLDVEETEVTPEASFTNDLGADSLDTVELIMEFEKEFNIQIPDDQAEKIQTVGHAIEYIETVIKQ